MEQKITEVAIRVYGILQNTQKAILLSEEQFSDFRYVKFPGGGLQPGESTKTCLQRELSEELDLQVNHSQLLHAYTCDQLITNRFNPKQQVIGVYYWVKVLPLPKNLLDTQWLELPRNDGKVTIISRYWTETRALKNRLTFEMDRKAVNCVLSQNSGGY